MEALYSEETMRSYAESARAALLAELAGKMPQPKTWASTADARANTYAAVYNEALFDVRAALGLPEIP